MECQEISTNSQGLAELSERDKNLIYIECVTNSIKKPEVVCSIHSQETIVFCFSCKNSICPECMDISHQSHSCVNKTEYILEDLEKDKDSYFSLNLEDDNYEMLESLKEKVEQDFVRIKDMVEKSKNDRLKQIELHFLNYEISRNDLKERIKKSCKYFSHFCETYKGMVNSDAIKFNDAAFLQIYNILLKSSASKSELINVIIKKKQDLESYIDTIKQANLKFEKMLHDILTDPFITNPWQDKGSYNIFLNYDSNNLLINQINENEMGSFHKEQFTDKQNFFQNNFVRIDNAEDVIIEDLNGNLKKNVMFLNRFIKEIKIAKNSNGKHDKYTTNLKQDINLISNIDSKLFKESYVKFLQNNGEELKNILTVRSMVYLNKNKKECNRSLSGSTIQGKDKDDNIISPKRLKSSFVKSIDKLDIHKKKKSGEIKYKKDSIMETNSNKLNDTEGFGFSDRHKSKGKSMFKNILENKMSPSKDIKMESMISVKTISKNILKNSTSPIPYKTFNRDELHKKLHNKSKSLIKEKSLKKTSSLSNKIGTLTNKFESERFDNASNIESDFPVSKSKIKTKLSDNLIKILISSNTKIRSDPMKLINQYLDKNFNETKINDATIKTIFDKIFNHEAGKPIEGKNEIQIFDYSKCKIIKKEKVMNKSTHGCNLFLNGLRYSTINEKIYILGGKDWAQEYNICLCYDINTDSLTKIENMKNCRSYCSLITSDDEKLLYAIGGVNNKTCEVLNLESLSWKELPSMNFSRGNSSLYIFKSIYLYVFSGFKENRNANIFEENIERLDLSKSMEWEILNYKNSSYFEMKLGYSGIIPLTGGHILIFGGESSRYKTKCQVIYDLNKNEIINADDKLEEIRKDLLLDKKNSNNSKS